MMYAQPGLASESGAENDAGIYLAMQDVAHDPAYQARIAEKTRPFSSLAVEAELTRSIQRRFDRCCHGRPTRQ